MTAPKIDFSARLPFAMVDTPRITAAKRIEIATREARLSRALRDNLRRRKEQARARETPASELPDNGLPDNGLPDNGLPDNDLPDDKGASEEPPT